MSSKKKPRPSFEVPDEIGSGQESGWVYKSGTSEVETPAPPRVHRETHETSSGAGIGAASAHALTLAIATIAQTVVLVVTIAVTPMTLGMEALQALSKSGDAR